MLRRWLQSPFVRHAARLGRFVRGAVGMGLAWSVPWGIAAVLLSPYLWSVTSVPTPRSLVGALSVAGLLGAMFGWYGFLSGATFSLVLAVAARGRRLHELTKARMAALGTVASVLLTGPPTMYMLAHRRDGWRDEDAVFLAGGLLLSAGCAAASLMVARRRSDADDDAARRAMDAGGDALREFLPANTMLRSGRHAVVMPANVEPERVPIL
jgi:hypothetical protein